MTGPGIHLLCWMTISSFLHSSCNALHASQSAPWISSSPVAGSAWNAAKATGFGGSRSRRSVGDRESPSDQDPRCAELITSVLVRTPHAAATAQQDSSADIMSRYFGVPSSQKRSSEEYRFQTPNYPDAFPPNMECIKIISAPTRHQRVILTFRGLFELEPEPNCGMDFLEIRDGAFGYSPILGRYCSRRLPDLGKGLQSTGPYLWIRFRSDATINHRGFQAIYHFYEPGFRHRIDMHVGEMWTLDQKFLLDNLRDFPPDLHYLPLEASFDIRSPNDTFLMLHVANVTVPRELAWSCVPKDLMPRSNTRPCLSKNPVVFGRKTVKQKYGDMTEGLDKLLIQDPGSLIDGRRTIFEVYSHNSISPYATPCPRIRQFCDQSVGVVNLENNLQSERDFFVRSGRLIIRIVIASPSQRPPPGQRKHRGAPSPSGSGDAKLPPIRLAQMPVFHFQLTALKKAYPNVNMPCDEDWTPCDTETCVPKKFWCDKVMNCPQWQDEGGHCRIIEEDENGHQKSGAELRKEQQKKEADEESLAAQKLHLSILGSLGLLLLLVTITCIFMTVRRRRRERSRHSLKVKDNINLRPDMTLSPNRTSSTRLNHVMSTGTLLDVNDRGNSRDPSGRSGHALRGNKRNTDHNSVVLDAKLSSQANINWNSTDSVNAPLLWQRKPTRTIANVTTINTTPKTTGLLGNRGNQTVPNNLMATATKHQFGGRGVAVSMDADPGVNTRSPAIRLRTRAGPTALNVKNSPGRLLNSSGMMASPGSMRGTAPGDRPVTMTTRNATSSGIRNVGTMDLVDSDAQYPGYHPSFGTGHWTTSPGALSQLTSQSKRSIPDPHGTTIRASAIPHPFPELSNRTSYEPPYHFHSTQQQHMNTCSLINRTQSWGGELRLAGVDALRNGQWEVTHSLDDSAEVPDLETTRPRFTLATTESPIQTRAGHGPSRPPPRDKPTAATYVSMPNVNGSTWMPGWQKSTTSRMPEQLVRVATTERVRGGFKPPSAKRPRMIVNSRVGKSHWVPTQYGTETEEEGEGDQSATETGTLMDEFGSVRSGCLMPEMQDSPVSAYRVVDERGKVLDNMTRPVCQQPAARIYMRSTVGDGFSRENLNPGLRRTDPLGISEDSSTVSVDGMSCNEDDVHTETEDDDTDHFLTHSPNLYTTDSDEPSQRGFHMHPPEVLLTGNNIEGLFSPKSTSSQIPPLRPTDSDAQTGSSRTVKPNRLTPKDVFVYEYEA